MIHVRVSGTSPLARAVEQALELQPDLALAEARADVVVDVPAERLTRTERAESASDQMDEWEVQVVLPDHHSTRELADQLESEGLKPLRRWRYLVIPVPSEDDGNELATRLRAEAPPDAKVAVEASYGEVVAANPRLSAFALFGGLGG